MPLAEGLWPEPKGIRPVYSLKRFTCEQRLNQRPVGPLVKPLLDNCVARRACSIVDRS